jgi:hypothetical protein
MRRRSLATGLTPDFGRFDEAGFSEAQFEQELTDPRLALAAFLYWVRKLQARVFAGDHAAALAAAAQAERLIWTSPGFFERAEYHFYAALARCEGMPDANRHLEALAVHHRQLQLWAENCPENFADRAALISAEIARIEGRGQEAMALYEQAIHSAHDNGFLHNEALANERAAHFYAAGGFETISHAYLKNARYCYARWGADAKVRQLDQSYPQLRDEPPTARPTDRHDRNTGRPARPCNSAQGLSGRLRRDRPGKAYRHADAYCR